MMSGSCAPSSHAYAPPPAGSLSGSLQGSQPWLSAAYRLAEAAHCRRCAVQAAILDCACVPAKAGNSIAASTANVAMTTSNSTRVNAVRLKSEQLRTAIPPLTEPLTGNLHRGKDNPEQ